MVQSIQAEHDSIYLEGTLDINLGAPPSIQGRIEGLIAKIGLEIHSIKSMNFARFEDSSLVAKALLSHEINIGILSTDNILGQTETLKIINLYSEKRLWAVPCSVPISDVIESLRTARNINSHLTLNKYVITPTLASWGVGTVNWYRDNLGFSEPYFKATTHSSAIQIASEGFASCHIPATLIVNLPLSVKQKLNFFDLGALGRSICLAFPKHLCTNRSFMDFVGKCQSTIENEYEVIKQEILSEFDLIAIK